MEDHMDKVKVKKDGDKTKKSSPVSTLRKAFLDSAAEMAKSLDSVGDGDDSRKAMRISRSQETTHGKDQKLGSKIKMDTEDDGLDEHVADDRANQDTDEWDDEEEFTQDKEEGDKEEDEEDSSSDSGDDDEDFDKNEVKQRIKDEGNDAKLSRAMKKNHIKKSKSLIDELSADDEVSEALDVSPFLKRLTKGLSDRLESMQESLAKSQQEDIKSHLRPMAKSIQALGEMVTAVFDSVEVIGSQPQKSASLLKSQHDRFYGSPEKKEGDKDSAADMEVLEKSMDMQKVLTISSQIFDPKTCAKIQGRLNKGIPLEPEWIAKILKNAAKEDK
jgi:hypothetical protein